jgi:hypothetical protein
MSDEIPEFKIAKLELGPDDLIVIKATGTLSVHARTMLEAAARQVFPYPRKILVLDGDLELSVLTELEMAGCGGLK